MFTESSGLGEHDVYRFEDVELQQLSQAVPASSFGNCFQLAHMVTTAPAA